MYQLSILRLHFHSSVRRPRQFPELDCGDEVAVEKGKLTEMSLALCSFSPRARDEEIDEGEEGGGDIFRWLPRSEVEREGNWVAAYAA